MKPTKDIFRNSKVLKDTMVPSRYSVLLPCHKDRSYIYEAINSVIEDIPDQVSVFIVVHKNPRLYFKLRKKYIKFKNIIILLDENSRFLSGVLNFGLEHIKSEYIFRMDSDDIWLKGRFEVQKKFIERNPDISVLGGSLKVIDDNGKKIFNINKNLESVIDSKELMLNCCVAHPTTIYKRSDVIKVGRYNKRIQFAEDFDLWSRMLSKYSFANIPNYLIKYRIGSSIDNPLKVSIQNNETCHIIANNFLQIKIIYCKDLNHTFGTRLACKLNFIQLRLVRNWFINFNTRDNPDRTYFFKAFEKICELMKTI